MFGGLGADHGRADGAADAALGFGKRPRPGLALAIAFPAYRDAYLAAYADAYRQRRWHEERLRAEGLAAKNARSGPEARHLPAKGPATGARRREDAAFDAGWRDGRRGAEPTPAGGRRAPDEAAAYQRGYRIGVRDRDYARAKALRDRARGADGWER